MVKKKPADSTYQPTSSQETPTPPLASTQAATESLSAATPQGTARTPIVAVGASAGGLAAFEEFFDGISEASQGMAFVVIQHLSPDHVSSLGMLIERHTQMPLHTAENGQRVEIGHVYVIPPNRIMTIHHGKLKLAEPVSEHQRRMPIDAFLVSLSEDLAELAVAVILSGTGSDGTIGAGAIKASGGLVIAQHPETTEFDGMPSHVIEAGHANFELPPLQMGAALNAFVRHGERVGSPLYSDDVPLNELKLISHLVLGATGHDFSKYKPSTIQRRVRRRMALHHIDRVADYIEYLDRSPGEVGTLFEDFLIGVTKFFRDTGPFEALEEKVIAPLVKSKRHDQAIRVWVPGCASGEEAYSVAMLISECQEAQGKRQAVKIFATDIDSDSVVQARLAIYPWEIKESVSPERLARHFSPETKTADGDVTHYRVCKSIRDMVIFSEQNVIRDPSFSRLDLICCRNLMIYLGPELQENLMRVFHYSLKPDGVLFLGTSESTGKSANFFTALDLKSKLFKRLKAPGGLRSAIDRRPHLSVERYPAQPSTKGGSPGDLSLRELTERTLLLSAVPCAALVTATGDILYIHGSTGKYLEPAAGEAGVNNILKMAREGLKDDLNIALCRAVGTNAYVELAASRVRIDGDIAQVHITVRPAPTAELQAIPLYLVTLAPVRRTLHGIASSPPRVDGAAPHSDSVEGESPADEIARLRQQMREKEDYLQATSEELEATNEALSSSNEEMQSVNEELQSTNEELETSKEELQSVNEELSTVNSELEEKVSALSRANNDLNNLLAGTGVATIFLDSNISVLRFTPTATDLINFIPADVGRPLAHIATRLRSYDSLVEDAQRVMTTLTPFACEVETREGRWFRLSIQPYKTLDDLVEGVVITFIDITAMRKIEDQLRINEACMRVALESSPVCVFNQDLELHYTWIHDSTAYILSEDSIGSDDAACFMPKTAGELTKLKRDVLESGVGTRLSLDLTTKTATHRVQLAVEPLRDSAGRLTGVTGAAVLEQESLGAGKVK
jgi:two-component system CheB/CheR fusion protein